MAIREKKISLTSLSDLMPFGQYKGETMEWILENDPSYILWLEDKVDMDVSIVDRAYDLVFRDTAGNFSG